MFLPWRHTQCHGEVRPGGAAKAGTAHESGLGRRRRRRGHLRRRRVGHERLEGVELLLGRRRSKLGMCLNREAKNQHGLRVARRTTPERLAEGTQTYVTAKIDFCG